MHFERELYAALGEHVEDRVPALGELFETVVDHRVWHRRERIQQVPDGRAGEAVHHADAKFCAARAVFFISSAARLLTPSGLPSPQTCGGRMALWRASMMSQTAWPAK